MIMGIPRLFRLSQHRQFTYEPIYYDERKEQLQERIRNIENELGIKREDEVNIRTLSKGSFSHFHDRKRKSQKYSSLRLIIILLFLVFITYYLFFY